MLDDSEWFQERVTNFEIDTFIKKKKKKKKMN